MGEVVENGKWRDLRMHRQDLEVAGKAMLSFGVWTVLRTLFGIVLGDAQIDALVQSAVPEGSSETVQVLTTVFTLALFMILVLLGFLIHFLIYRGAIKESYGKKVGWFYLILTVIMGVSSIASIIYTVISILGKAEFAVADLLFDITITIICIDIFYNGINSKKLKKELMASGERV